jgi:Na+-transporting NADH:ubiquinone oxidoreductase subunit B
MKRLTAGAPHVRSVNSLSQIQLTRVIALLPVIIAAVLNTGYQYLLALDVAGGEGVGDWRDNALRSLGVSYQDPSVFGMVMAGLVHIMPVLFVAVLAGGLCERAFATKRDQPMTADFLVIAVVFTLLMPPAASLVHVALGMAFAIIFGKGVFGGEGKTFLNPALLGAAVVQISFPVSLVGHPLWTGVAGYSGSNAFALYDQNGGGALTWAGLEWWSAFLGTTQGMIGTTSVLAVLLGGTLLVWSRIASWRLICGQVLGLLLIATLCNLLGGGILGLQWYWHLVLGSFAFGTVFVATDPASSASTDAGRWIQGLLVGGLVVMIRVVNESHPDGVIPALLMGSILAPLIDYIVIWFNVRQRARRHG